MRKSLTAIFTEGQPDTLGNCENVSTSIEFRGEASFVTMTFDGRDGSSDKAISIDDLRSIFQRIGIDC